jgi:hypothetical protein
MLDVIDESTNPLVLARPGAPHRVMNASPLVKVGGFTMLQETTGRAQISLLTEAGLAALAL